MTAPHDKTTVDQAERDNWERSYELCLAERNELRAENVRLARQVADLAAALHGIADDGACASDSRVARAALAAARSRDPQEGA